MQDVMQLALDDAEVATLFEGVSAGAQVKITLDVTVSEIDEERVHATIDSVHDDVSIIEDIELDEAEEDDEVESDEADAEEEDTEEEEY